MEFPQYRKYANIETYFKIISEKEFEELAVMGKKYIDHWVRAEQYPEMLRIQDMLNNEGGLWEVLTEETFVDKRNYILKNYQSVKK